MWPGHRKSRSKSCGRPHFLYSLAFRVELCKNLKLKKWNFSVNSELQKQKLIIDKQRLQADIKNLGEAAEDVEWFVNYGRRIALGRAPLSGYKSGIIKKKKSLGVISRHFVYYCWRPLINGTTLLLTVDYFKFYKQRTCLQSPDSYLVEASKKVVFC